MKEIIKKLRNWLKARQNKEYVRWWADNKKRNFHEGHHLLGSYMGAKKWCDLLIGNCRNEVHTKIHYQKQNVTDDELFEILRDSLENLFDYVEYLQKENKQLKEQLEKKVVLC